MSIKQPKIEREDEDGLEECDIHEALSNDRRIKVIRYVNYIRGPVDIGEVSEHIAEVESGTSPPPTNLRKSVYVSLHQTHLPKLDNLDVIEYDPNSKTINPKRNIDELNPYMRDNIDARKRSHFYYIALGLIGISALTVPVSGIASFDRSTIGVISLFFLVLIISLALYNSVYNG
ncbi:MAG: hypothetical protein SV377_01265 [Halobacteria archaeon]|nr:hypothetical protein [Halobacteria archaeon]